MKIKLSSKWIDVFLILFLVLFFPFCIYLSLHYPNVILEQGLAHRIFYFHVPVAWVALYAPLLSCFFSILYLYSRKEVWDTFALTSNKISLLFSVAVLFSGPIWAKSAWGTFWDWTDARLQSFLILCISLLTYFVVRELIVQMNKKYLFSAFLSILCSLNAVITWGSIRWIENPGNHPGPVIKDGSIDTDMRVTFWLCVLAYHVLFLVLFKIIYRYDRIVVLREKCSYSNE